MRVSEVVHAFQSMSACERLYLLCQLLHKCIAFEIRYLAGFLGSLLQSDPSVVSLSKHESDANKAAFFSRLEEKEGMNGLLCQDGLSKMCCGLALLGGDNKAVGEEASQQPVFGRQRSRTQQVRVETLRIQFA